jgi:hypothetical protein
MSILNLSENQSLESIRKKVEEASQRPAYIASGCTKHGTNYKFPGEDECRTDVNPVELFLSRLTDKGRCVRGEGKDGKVHNYYDLVPARTLHIFVPMLPGENSVNVKRHFETAGLHAEFNARAVIFSPKKYEVPAELKPFVVPYRRRPGSSCIWFVQSQAIDSPDEVRHSWHLGAKIADFYTIQPPGQYSNGEAPHYLVRNNGFAVANVNPGRCIVCHGESGDRRHFGMWEQHIATWIFNSVCLPCLRRSTQEWIELLEKL